MIDLQNFKFSTEQRRNLKKLKVNDRQIGALECIVPACAIYLSPGEVPTMTETRECLERTRSSAFALARLFDVKNASPVEQLALRLVSRNMDLGDFAASMRTHSAAFIAAVDDALKEREATKTKHERNETMPLRLIYYALRDNHIEGSDVSNSLPGEPSKFRFYPSQSNDGPFVRVANVIYELILGEGSAAPKNAMQTLSKEVKPITKAHMARRRSSRAKSKPTMTREQFNALPLPEQAEAATKDSLID